MEAPPTFNMFGRRADSMVRAEELHFGYAQLWEGSAADINLQATADRAVLPVAVTRLWSDPARAGCDEKKGRPSIDKGQIVKDENKA